MQVSHFVEHTKCPSPRELLSPVVGSGGAFQMGQSSTSQSLSWMLAALGFRWSPTGGRKPQQTNCPLGEERKRAETKSSRSLVTLLEEQELGEAEV